MYVTFAELFQFCLVLIGLASLLLTAAGTHKKK